MATRTPSRVSRPIVYGEPHKLARRPQCERAGHSLRTSALVNESDLRLVEYKRMQRGDCSRLFTVCFQVMRLILVDHARGHNLKRGGKVQHVSVDEAAVVGETRTSI